MNLTSFKRFHAELVRLDVLSRTCEFAFEVASRELRRQAREGRIDRAAPAYLPSDPTCEVAGSYYIILNKLDSQFPRCIRETVFVRLISTFEVFLVDLARDVFLRQSDLFHSAKTIELTHAEALSMSSTAQPRERILSTELRQLHSAGVREVAKYYERHMGIRFPDLIDDFTRLLELHDRRHLLVHRLGRADQSYRHKYGYDKKGVLSIATDYLQNALQTISEFADALQTEVASLLAAGVDRDSEAQNAFEVEIEIATASDEAEHLLAPSYGFVVNDRVVGERGVVLNDILAYSRASDGWTTQVLCGDRETVRSYLREVKRLSKRGLLSVVREVVHEDPIGERRRQRPMTLDRGTVERIARLLPVKPWPTGVHKEIAMALSISNTQCSRAITAILRDESLSSLVGADDNG